MNKAAPDKWGTPIQRDFSGVEILREIRGVRLFDQMPLYAQKVYLQIAACYPNIQVWACGSRVRGEYVEPRDGAWIREARQRAGMKDKTESDFDFWLERGDIKPTGELPKGAEQAKCRVPDSEKIAIPIYVGLEQNT